MNFRLGVVILTFYTCIVHLQVDYVQSSEEPDLYSSIDDVIRLNATTFIPTVFHQNKNLTYMVQFYNTFCGHCQMFAPIYKDLASRVKNWTSVFKVAGVDCSKDENTITCSENKITGYPTILIYPPNARYQEPDDKPFNLREKNIEWNVDNIEETMIDYISNLSHTRKEFPLVVDALEPITTEDPRDIKRLYPAPTKEQKNLVNEHHDQDIMLVAEPENSYLGRKLIIEYYRISSRLEIRRILLTNTKLLKALLSEEDFKKLNDEQPLLLLLKGTGVSSDKAQVIVRGEYRHILPTSPEHERIDFIYNRFNGFLEQFYSIELQDSGKDDQRGFVHPKKSTTNRSEYKIKHDNEVGIQYLIHDDPVGSRKIFAIDLMKGISYMLTHEVRVKGDLSPLEFDTVRNLLTILRKYLPLETWDPSIHNFIEDFRTRLDGNRSSYSSNGVTAQEMRDLLDLSGAEAIKLKYSRENWVSCSDSDLNHKGYTCSLWLLFHTLTVGEYQKASPKRIRPTLVLFTMRDYITKFLGCTVCSSNFEKETESLTDDLNTRNSSILWLWDAHNRVRERLNTEKQDHRHNLNAVIFPSSSICPQCLKTNIEEIGLDGKTSRDIEWNLTSVLDYLIETYRPDRVVSPAAMTSLLTSIKNKLNYNMIEVDNKNSDMSLCLILLLVQILILVQICWWYDQIFEKFPKMVNCCLPDRWFVRIFAFLQVFRQFWFNRTAKLV